MLSFFLELYVYSYIIFRFELLIYFVFLLAMKLAYFFPCYSDTRERPCLSGRTPEFKSPNCLYGAFSRKKIRNSTLYSYGVDSIFCKCRPKNPKFLWAKISITIT